MGLTLSCTHPVATRGGEGHQERGQQRGRPAPAKMEGGGGRRWRMGGARASHRSPGARQRWQPQDGCVLTQGEGGATRQGQAPEGCRAGDATCIWAAPGTGRCAGETWSGLHFRKLLPAAAGDEQPVPLTWPCQSTLRRRMSCRLGRPRPWQESGAGGRQRPASTEPSPQGWSSQPLLCLCLSLSLSRLPLCPHHLLPNSQLPRDQPVRPREMTSFPEATAGTNLYSLGTRVILRSCQRPWDASLGRTKPTILSLPHNKLSSNLVT